jgi:predicted RNA-binding protein with PIN domain
MKILLIDGNNLIGKIRSLSEVHKKNKQASREQLVLLLNRISRKENIFLYFDGFENIPLSIPKGRIYYSGKKPADVLIKKEIETAKNPKNLIVVSSDNELKNFARVCSCSIISSEEFAKQIKIRQNDDEEKIKSSGTINIKEWEKLFQGK